MLDLNDDDPAVAADDAVFNAADSAVVTVSPDPLEGPRWSSTNLTWSFAAANYGSQPGGASFSSFITDATVQGLVRKAAALWSAVSGLVLTQVADSSTANIRIGYERLNTPSTGTLGLTSYTATTGSLQQAVIGLEDPSQLGTTATPDGDLVFNNAISRVFQVIVHEFGHALGLAHNTVDAQAVMSPVATASNRGIDLNDTTAIEGLYGGSSSRLAGVSISNAGQVRFAVATGGTVNPFASLAVTDGASLNETVKVTVAGGGTLRDPTSGTDASFSGGVFTESGMNLTVDDEAQTILRRLVYTAPSSIGSSTFEVEVGNSLQGDAAYGPITVGYGPVTTPPSITGLMDRSTTDLTPVAVFAGVTIADANAGQTQTVAVTLSAPQNGSFSNLGGGSYAAATGTYSVSGTAAQVSAALAGLVFTPTVNQVAAGGMVTTTLTVSDVNAAGASVSGVEKVVATGTAPTTPVFSIAAASADQAEGNSGVTPFTFTLTRTGNVAAAQTVAYAVAGSGANPANAADFGGVLPSGSVAFAAGETTKTITVGVSGDTTNEPDETFTVTIAVPSGSSAYVASAVGTIRNDDTGATNGPVFAIAAASADKAEGNSGTTPFTFTVTRTGDTSGAQTVGYSVTGSGANPADATDFGGALPSGSVAFASGETAKTITIGVSGDTTYEPDETFTVTLGTPSAGTIGTGAAGGTIRNDEAGLACGVVDGTTGKASVVHMDGAAAGGPSYLQSQYIYAGSDDLAISTQAPNVFLHTGAGNDALQVANGQNVLDGGLGSNFLTGGTGADTFFTDARSAGVVWNTIRNFHAGDAATLWGFASGVSSYRWEPNVAGAAGSEGATLRANIVGGAGRSGDGIDASITFTGLTVAQAQGLQVVTGTQAAGSYLFLYNPGV